MSIVILLVALWSVMAASAAWDLLSAPLGFEDERRGWIAGEREVDLSGQLQADIGEEQEVRPAPAGKLPKAA